jgi:P27 family predicted phage terminase small subunit
MRGPKPKSTQALIATGSRRARGRKDPPATMGIPKKPPVVAADAVASQQWKLVSRELHKMGVLATVDVGVLSGYCLCWAQYMECQEWIKANGKVVVYRDDKGNVKGSGAAAHVTLSLKFLDQIRRLGEILGLAPVARARLSMGGSNQAADEMEAFIASKPRPELRIVE